MEVSGQLYVCGDSTRGNTYTPSAALLPIGRQAVDIRVQCD
jgi:hypothetical protein